ncbi:MAG TPA: PQQ-binding-like beta-propeller repeat protein, partial [Ktedonobacterales bacterium]|nr:PQQ-binding-like beta-propeller repeat protein [Ktedonobacterales bacterium]
QLWRYPTHDGDAFISGPLAPLVVEGGRVYLASLDFGLYVLDAATGRELWRAPLDNGIFNSAGTQPDLSTPAVDQGTGIVVLVAPNRVEAWRVADGQKLWVAHIPNNEDSALVDSAAVAAGMVYLAQEGTQATCDFNGIPPHVLALRDTDGTKRWQGSI